MASHEAEEVVAQTFLIAWQRVNHLPKDPVPWLFGVARNVIRNLDRSRRRQSMLAARVASVPTNEEVVSARDHQAEKIREALASLSHSDREILLLVAWDWLDHSQAAAVMGWSKANFRLRLHRARKRFRQRLHTTDRPFLQTSLRRSVPAQEEAR